jgi:adenylate cyclase
MSPHARRVEPATGHELAERLRRRLTATVLVANLSGGVVVFAFLGALLPQPEGLIHFDAFTAVLAAYVALSLPLALAWSTRRGEVFWRWLREERQPNPRERELALREPLSGLVVGAALWGVAAPLFGAIQGAESGSLHEAMDVALTVALGGLTTCAVTYLLSEWVLRPATARALAAGPPSQPVGPGVGPRLLIGWALVTGVPVLGVTALAISTLSGDPHGVDPLAVSALILATSALIGGLVATLASARSLAQSLHSLREALARIRAGDLAACVAVDDSGELGLLQVGFNEMAAGLRERERIREAFGTTSTATSPSTY